MSFPSYLTWKLVDDKVPDQLQITNCTIRTGKEIFAKLVGQDLQLFTKFPYRVSCLDQQGQMDPLITETTDENESKMRPITTRA